MPRIWNFSRTHTFTKKPPAKYAACHYALLSPRPQANGTRTGSRSQCDVERQDDWWKMHLKGFGRKRPSLPNGNTIPAFTWSTSQVQSITTRPTSGLYYVCFTDELWSVFSICPFLLPFRPSPYSRNHTPYSRAQVLLWQQNSQFFCQLYVLETVNECMA